MRSLSRAAKIWKLRSLDSGGTKQLDNDIFELEKQIATLRHESLTLKSRILAEAREQATLIREEARQDGYREGLQEGHMQAQLETEKQLQSMRSEFQEALQLYQFENQQILEETLDQLSDKLTQIAILIATKLMGDETPRTLSRSIVRQAVGHLCDWGEVTLKVPACDKAQWETQTELRVESDEELTAGDFLLDAEGASVDGRWESRWGRLLECLEEQKI